MFNNIGLKIANIVHLSASEAINCLAKGAILLDIREEYETAFKQFKAEQIHYLPISIIRKDISSLEINNTYIVADSVGLYSKPIVEYLLEKGFLNVANLNGGIKEWEHDGYPVVKFRKNPLVDEEGNVNLRTRAKAELENKSEN